MIAVTLHGFTGDSSAWRDVVPGIGLPLAGHHRSVPAEGTSFAGEVDRLAREITELARGAPVHLLGYSMGARCAAGVAVARPDLCARLTLVGLNPGLPTEDERRARRAADERWCRLLEVDGIVRFVNAWEALPLWRTQERLPPEARAAQRATRLAHDPRELARSLRALGLGAMPDLGPALAEIRAPVDLVAGALDDKFCRLAAETAARLRRGRVVTVPGAGHNPILERPRALAALVDLRRRA